MHKTNVSEFRNADQYNEDYVKPIMDKIYTLMGWQILERVEDQRQYKGADVILKIPMGKGVAMIATVDEKMDTLRKLNASYGYGQDPCCTFSQELHMKNQAGNWQNGWLHPSVRASALNQYYMYVWIDCEKDQPTKKGKITSVKQIEVCMVHHNDLVEYLERDDEFEYSHAFINGIINKIKKDIEDGVVGENEHKSYKGQFPFKCAYPFYSGDLKEKPINLIVPKRALRDISTYSFAFNLEGSNRKERLVSYRRTKWTKGKYDIKEFHPITEFVA